jgi:hypothetical protein
MKTLQLILLTGMFLVALVSLPSPCAVWAQDGDPPDDSADDDSDSSGSGSIITHIFELIFPIETMQAATEILLVNVLQRNAEGIRQLFSGLVADLTLQNPGIKESSGSLMWLGVDVFVPTWNFTVKIAVALWPATLAIMAAVAAQESAIATDWGVAGLKGALAQWLHGVLMCAFSLEVIDLLNRLSNAIVEGIVTLPIRGAVGLNVQAIVNALLGASLRVFGMGVSPAAAIIAVLVELVLGLALVISIVGQYFARVALLYVIVALAPIVLVIGILRPARWLQWTWIKGLLLVMLLGPITALLFKLILALHTAIVNPILSFLMVVGVTSVLLTVNGAIIKGVFGAATEVVGKALDTATGVVQGATTAAVAVGAAVLSGGAALGVLPATLGGSAGAAGGGAAASSAVGSAGSSGAGTVAVGVAAGATPGGAAATGSGTMASARESARAAVANTSLETPPTRAEPDTGEESSATGGVAPSIGDGATAGGGGTGTALSGVGGSALTETGGGSGFLGKIRRKWDEAAPHERIDAVGAAMRAGGTILGPRSLAGRAMGTTGAGLQMGARVQAEELGAPQAGPAAGRAEGMSSGSPSSDANLSALGADEVLGYQQAMRDVRRDLRTPMQAAGLDLRQVERDALAPVWAATQHDTLSNIARQAGFGNRGSTMSQVGDFVAYRIEGQLMAQGFLSERITRPGSRPVVPLSDTPALVDYDKGQQLAWATGKGNMASYAGLHHAIRRHASTPQAGLDAAGAFYSAALENRSVAGVIEAAQEYGAQAGVPEDRLQPWLQELGGA